MSDENFKVKILKDDSDEGVNDETQSIEIRVQFPDKLLSQKYKCKLTEFGNDSEVETYSDTRILKQEKLG